MVGSNSYAEAGYKALFLSVDVPVLGKRLNEYRNNYTLPKDMSWPNILSNGSDTSNRTDYDPSLDWESTIPWLRENTSLQIWLKGGLFRVAFDLGNRR